MADAKLTALLPGGAITDSDLFYSVQGANDVRQSALAFKSYVGVASGAGVKNFVTDFGGVGNGSTDNSSAWNAFQGFAAAESTAGRGVNLVIPPGIYNYDHSLCVGYLFRIKKLYIQGYGAVIQNTYDPTIHGGNAAFEWALSPANEVLSLFNGVGPLIQTTAVGDSQVTLLAPAQTSQFAAGDWVMVSSLDIQYYGYPPNCDRFEFLQIATINSSTGVIAFASGQTLAHVHRSDFADGGNPNACGKARIWQLRYTGIPWEVDHLYEGIEVRTAPNSTLVYINCSGLSWKALNCTLPGISPSIAKYVEIRGGSLTAQSEPDKLVTGLLLDGVRVKQRFAFQSSSIDCVTLRNCQFDVDLETGTTKQTLVQNCIINSFTESVAGQPFGTARGLTLDSCVISSMSETGLVGAPVTIDGVNVIYASGVFQILKTGTPASWGIALGSMIGLAGSLTSMAGNLGVGIVTKISENANYILIQTTLPYVTLPSWATSAFPVRNGTYSVRNCTGCDAIIRQSKATALGSKTWEMNTAILTTNINNISSISMIEVGNLISVTANVIQASTSGKLEFDLGAINATTMAGPRIPYVIDIDLTHAGLRTFTQSALTGSGGADAVTYNSVAQTSLVVNALCLGGNQYTVFFPSPGGYPSAVVEFTLRFDTGIFRSMIPSVDMSP